VCLKKIVNLIKDKKNSVLLVIFLTVNIILFLFSFKDATLIEGADSGQYFYPALSFADKFELRTANGDLLMFGTPLYSVFLGIIFKAFGSSNLFFVVMSQCVLLFMTGMIARKIGQKILKKDSFIIQILLIFNPNSLITSHLIQSETLFTFILILIVYLIVNFENLLKSKKFLLAVLFGLLTLTRPAGLYFSIFIVFSISLILHLKFRHTIIQIFQRFTLPVLIVFTLSLSPWLYRNFAITGEVFLSTNAGAYLKDQYLKLLTDNSPDSEIVILEKVDKNLKAYFAKNANYCIDNERNWRCNSLLEEHIKEQMLQTPVEHHIKSLGLSFMNLFFSPGSSNYRNYLAIDGKRDFIEFLSNNDFRYTKIEAYFKTMNYGYYSIFILTAIYSIVLKIFAISGLYKGLINKNTRLNIVFFILIFCIFMAMYLYLGQSRFRVPLEPILVIIAYIGLIKRKDEKNN